MTSEYYMAHTGYMFVPPHNPGNYLPTIGTYQEQALGTERFQKKQALFRRCTTVDGGLKGHIITAVQPVLLSALVDQLTGFGQVTALQMIQNLFNSYNVIDKIDLEENAVKMMDQYYPTEPLSRLFNKLEKGREFLREGGQTIDEAIMFSKGITLLAHTSTFNKDIQY